MRNILRTARTQKGLTQQQVADMLGISLLFYQLIEYGKKTGRVEIWDKLEDIFNVHQRELRYQEDNQ